jgi:hypothetical protein
MSPHLLIETTGRITVAVAVLAIAVIAKAWAPVLQTLIEQAFRNRRLYRSLEGVKPHQRAEIIIAFGELEGKSAGGPGGDETGGLVPADADQPPLRILQNKRRNNIPKD